MVMRAARGGAPAGVRAVMASGRAGKGRNQFRRAPPGPLVRFQDGGQLSAGICRGVVVHDGFHQFPDAGEGEFSLNEGVHRHFIGGVVDGGQGAAAGAGPARQVQGGEGVRTGRLEHQLAYLRKVERGPAT